MPLDHVNGEDIGRLGRGSVVEISKWADTPMFDLACDAAERAFTKAGGLLVAAQPRLSGALPGLRPRLFCHLRGHRRQTSASGVGAWLGAALVAVASA